MSLGRDVLCRIVERAASLAERLEGTLVVAGTEVGPEAHARLARWSTLTARSDPHRFERRLHFDGLTRESALRALGDVRLGSETPLPAWALLLDRALTAKIPLDADRACDPASPIPFENVLRPFLLVARDDVAAHADGAIHRLNTRAHARLERVLLEQLSWLAAPSLQAERDAQRPMADFFAEYAALARLLATCVHHWADATAEMLRRIVADDADLATQFNRGRALGDVVDAQAGLSDPHRRGRTVCILRFASGTVVVYKPRSLAMEKTFETLVAWLAQRSEEPHLSALHVLDRGTHGWMEFAAPTGCSEEVEVERYFERGGMLLCVMHTLGGSDIHQDNVLARGEHPLALDLEALAGPVISPQGLEQNVDPTPWSHVLESPLATGMVPLLRPRYDGTAESSGGLTTNGAITHPTNVPTLRGQRVCDEHPASVLAGYSRMYRAILAHRDDLLSPSGPLAPLGAACVRIVFRPTQVYMALLERATAPRLMREGVDRSIEMDVLRQPFTKYPLRHRLWTALASELDALEVMDIPIFEVEASGTTLSSSRGPISGYVCTSGCDRIVARIGAMRGADLERQLHYIRLAYTGHRQRRERPVRAARDVSLTDAALDAAELLARSAVTARDGSATWHTLGAGGTVGDLQEVDLSLASGRVGIALFFAAAARVFGNERNRQLALSALAPFLGSAGAGAEELGASRGDGGVAYGLITAGLLLEERALVQAAERTAAAITPARIAGETDFTVWSGLSGALLGLLAVHDATGSSDVLARAAMCGRRLLSTRAQDSVTGLRAWRTRGGDFASGFAYGASGVAHALLSLYQRTGAVGLRDAADEAAELEDTLFVPAHNDWAVGIGLSRAASLKVSDTQRARVDLAAAIASMPTNASSDRLAKPDHLWCGNLGQAELLMVAGLQLGRPDLELRAREIAHRVTKRGRQRGTYGDGTMEAAFTPGLFDGLAGIGYELLRLHNPASVPSVLLFEQASPPP